MARSRAASDWDRDLAGARPGEAELLHALRSDPRLSDVEDHTAAIDRLDFAFGYRGRHVELDLKEKRQSYSRGYRDLWPDKPEQDLFILDEVVYRRIVWQGGGGYLAVHDLPGRRWVFLGPWELTLGDRRRFARRGDRGHGTFEKGKLLIDLASGRSSPDFTCDLLLAVIDAAWRHVGAVQPVAADRLPTIG